MSVVKVGATKSVEGNKTTLVIDTMDAKVDKVLADLPKALQDELREAAKKIISKEGWLEVLIQDGKMTVTSKNAEGGSSS